VPGEEEYVWVKEEESECKKEGEKIMKGEL
jgi:hypothetical protein